MSDLLGILSYSFMVTREDLDDDTVGYVPRPTDQRHTISAYLEDRMSIRIGRIQESLFHIRVLYGSGFPFTPKTRSPDADDLVLVQGPRNSRRGNSYFRFDVGATQTVTLFGLSVEVREEVANMFDQFNTVGFEYLPTPDGSVIELRNSLGRRIFNFSLAMSF